MSDRETDSGRAIEFNAEFRQALRLMEASSANVFVTGRAGTGKSTLLRYFRDTTEKDLVVLAPTGVAAVNIGGQTVHSFFGFGPDITLEKARQQTPTRQKAKLYQQLEAIVVDEISMVRADLLDCMEAVLRQHGPRPGAPFGGVQMIFIGDLYQLAPVVPKRERPIFEEVYDGPYFFNAHTFPALEMTMVELQTVYRQQEDPAFLDVLNAIRNRTVTDEHLATLNGRYQPDFQPAGEELFVHLTTTNAGADAVNAERLAALDARGFTFEGELTGDFTERSLPAPLTLELKEGAQVMLVNNDASGRWINGTLATVADIARDADGDWAIAVELEDGDAATVEPHTWEMYEYAFDAETGRIQAEPVGAFTQFPPILAWAITIHKAQGKTFDRAIVDFERGTFAHGQAYVALSRCTSLAGLVLKRPIKKGHVRLDWQVVRFITGHQYERSEREMPLDEKLARLREAAEDGQDVEIVYLKASDERSQRRLTVRDVGEMAYRGKTFPGVRAYCHKRRDERVFRVDRILHISAKG